MRVRQYACPAICVSNEAEELLTRDPDFSLFPELNARDPIPG